MSACAIERAAGMRSAVRSHHQGATMRRSARRVQRSSPSNQCLLSSRSANVAQVFIAPRTMGSSTVWVNGQASGTLRLFATRPSREAVRRPASCVSSSISSSALDAQAYEAELDRQVDALNLGQLPFAEPAGAGLMRDIRNRLLPYYVSDFKDGFNTKISNRDFGHRDRMVLGLLQEESLPYASGTFERLSQVLGVDFLPFYAWVGIWASLFLVGCTLFSVSNLVKYFTRFTDETFSAMSSCIFMYESTKHLTKALFVANPDSGSACLTLLVGLATCATAFALSSLKSTALFTQGVRERLSEFAPTISVLAITTAALHMSKRLGTTLPTLSLPTGITTSTGRPWLVDLLSLEPSMIALAVVPAIMLTTLLFMDQVITTRLVNTTDNKLKKGYGYHLDLAVIALYTAACSMFGLPWMTAATVPSLNHAHSLALYDKTGEMVGLLENRVSNMIVHMIMGCSLLFLGPVLKMVPQAVFMGLFLYLGISAAMNNKFLKRCVLLITDPEKFESQLTPSQRSIAPAKQVKSSINKYTLIQIVCLYSLWTVKSLQGLGIVFPLLVALLIPVRIFAIGMAANFSRSMLLELDQCADPIAAGKREYAIETGLLQPPAPTMESHNVAGQEVTRVVTATAHPPL